MEPYGILTKLKYYKYFINIYNIHENLIYLLHLI